MNSLHRRNELNVLIKPIIKTFLYIYMNGSKRKKLILKLYQSGIMKKCSDHQTTKKTGKLQFPYLSVQTYIV